MDDRTFGGFSGRFRRPAQGGAAGGVSETRKIAAILVSDMVGYSRLAGADEDRTLSRLRGLRSDPIDQRSPCTTGAWRARLSRGVPNCRPVMLRSRPAAIPPEATFAGIHDRCSASGRSRPIAVIQENYLLDSEFHRN